MRDNICLLLDKVNHLTNRDIDRVEKFNAFSTSVFNIDDGPWDPWSPVLEDCDWRDDKLPAAELPLNMFKTCCFTWMYINLWGSLGLIPGY